MWGKDVQPTTHSDSSSLYPGAKQSEKILIDNTLHTHINKQIAPSIFSTFTCRKIWIVWDVWAASRHLCKDHYCCSDSDWQYVQCLQIILLFSTDEWFASTIPCSMLLGCYWSESLSVTSVENCEWVVFILYTTFKLSNCVNLLSQQRDGVQKLQIHEWFKMHSISRL